MQVEMIDGLTAVIFTVDHQPIPSLNNAGFAGHVVGREDKRLHNAIAGGFMNTGDMPLGHKQIMSRSLRMDVLDSQNPLVFKNDDTGNFAFNNFAKKAIRLSRQEAFSSWAGAAAFAALAAASACAVT